MIILFIHVVCSWDERVSADGGHSWESLCQRHSPSPPLNTSLHQPTELNSGRGFSRTPSFWRAGVLSTTWWPYMGFCDGWIVKNSSMLPYCSMSLQYTVFCMHWKLRLSTTYTFQNMQYRTAHTARNTVFYKAVHSAWPFVLKVIF